MKKLVILFSFLFVTLVEAQTTTENYTSIINCLNEDCTKKIETVQYFDLLGRTKQVVNVKATPLGKDIVTPIVYDNQGRQTRSYLPVPQSSTSNGGIYSQASGMIPYPVADVTNIYSGEKIYTETVFENSPLQRVLQQKGNGNDWDGKAVIFGYDVNTAADHVKNYQVTASWDDTEKIYKNELQYVVVEYAAGQLIKNTITDEDGNKVVEFKDASGQTVLSRKVMDATQNADTYYVYNDYKQLAYVIPPLASITTLNSTSVDNLCYQYKYDSKNRLVEKKLPGKGWEYMVYNSVNQLILTQDTVLKGKGQWLFIKYDQFGRTVYTGMTNNTSGRASMQNSASINTNLYETRTTTAGLTLNGMPVYYTKLSTPTNVTQILSVNYYDSYPDYSFNPSFPSSIQGKPLLKEIPFEGKSTKGLPVAGFVKNIEDDNWTKNYVYYDLKARVVGSYSINHLGGYTKTESLLDFAGVTQQSKVWHKRLSTDPEKVITQTFTYDNQNRLLVHKHQVDANPEEILIQNEYNELSQLKKRKLGGTNPAQPLQNIDYTYNIRGWLTKINDPSNLNGKLFGYEMKYTNPVNSNVASGKFSGMITEVDWKNASEDVLKRYNYAYEGLGRLKDAVYSEPAATTPSNNYYNEYLTYDLNGNIKTLKRNAFPVNGTTATQVDDLVYNYTGNRLTKVTENALNDTGYEGGNNIISYDLNGNMKDMLDKGIQSVQYNYLNLSNQYTVQQSDRFGLTMNSTMNYLYRADGTKLRKTYSSTPLRGSTITRITDYLDGFQYSYTESGGICLECRTESAYEQQAYKNASLVLPETPTPEWKLDFISTAAGYYSFTENRYIYQYKDHLGNTRVSFAKNSAGAPEIIDTNNYYPFGLNHISNSFSTSNFGSFYSYKYNGKELQETGLFDYGWRQYMPDLGRWNGIDQLAEAYTSTSPFAYVANNPVLMRDPDGRWMDENGHIDTSGYANPFRHLGKKSMMNQFLGQNPGDGGGGSYMAFGDTQAYADLMDSFQNGGEFSLKVKNGFMSWWTGGAEGDANTAQEMIAHMMKLVGDGNSLFNTIDFSQTTSNTTWWVNTAVGAASTANVPRTGVFQYNDLWHQTKTRGTSFRWQNRWKNPGAKFWRGQQVKGFQGARSLGTKLTAAGGVLLVADVAMSGQVKPSHIINGAMLGASMSGVGSIVAGAWFVVDMGTGGVNYLSGNGFTTLSDVIDQSEWGQNVTVDMYDGLY
ncbi:DUF6443 domain-containing protein [Chryseobacterium sp.]|uniref:DUF6443 domain-containing protein n=1 Tax=Chryseobacterium sp. TaxID=1871047 RepID=UPI0031D69E4D